MKKQEFNEIVKECISRGRQFLVVKIRTDGNDGLEIIINGAENFKQKLAYYDKAYNDDMELIKAKQSGKLITIEDALVTNNLAELNWFVY